MLQILMQLGTWLSGPAGLTAAVGILGLWLNWRNDRRASEKQRQLHRDTLSDVRRAVADLPALRRRVDNHDLQLGLVWNESRAHGFNLPETRPRADAGD